MKHSIIKANGIDLHVVELGEGPPVLFCHGFPDTWRGWRRQLEAVAQAGFRAIAPDMRGYGRSSAPVEAEQYTPFQTVGDLVELLDQLHLPSATIVGHDFGAHVAWHAALLRPDRFPAVFALSVAFAPRGDESLLTHFRKAGQENFYMFRQLRPEADQEWADASRSIPGALYWLSATPPPAERFDPLDGTFRFNRPTPVAIPPWADADDVAYTVAEFTRTGFHGGLNYYRMIEPFFALSAAFKGSTVQVPCFFAIGAADGLKKVGNSDEAQLRQVLPNLRGYLEVENAGHWPQQENPEAVTQALLGFLHSL